MQKSDYTHAEKFPLPKPTKLLRDVCRKLGIILEVIDKQQGYLVKLTWGSDTAVLQSNQVTINTFVSAKISQDKVYTYRVLQNAGVRVPRGSFFLERGHFIGPDYSKGQGIEEAVKFGAQLARALGYPLIVKPNHLSAGFGVTRVENKSAIRPAVQRIFSEHEEHNVLVQEYIDGQEYRCIVLKERIVLCYKRLFATLRGDGKRRIRSLASSYNENCPVRARLDLKNSDLLKLLKKQGFSPNSVPARGKQVIVNNTTTNLARGGRLRQVRTMHESFHAWAKIICRELGLSYAAIDFRTSDIGERAELATVLEVNASPSLVHSYSKMRDKTPILDIYRVLLAGLLKRRSTAVFRRVRI